MRAGLYDNDFDPVVFEEEQLPGTPPEEEPDDVQAESEAEAEALKEALQAEGLWEEEEVDPVEAYISSHPLRFIAGLAGVVVLALSVIAGGIKAIHSSHEKASKAAAAETLRELDAIGSMEKLTPDERGSLVGGMKTFCAAVHSHEFDHVAHYNPETNSFPVPSPTIASMERVVQDSLAPSTWPYDPTDRRYVKAIEELRATVAPIAKAEALRKRTL